MITDKLPRGSRIYVAGKMRGEPIFNYKNFFHAQVELEKLGYKVINPAAIDCARMLFGDWKFTDDKYEEVISMDLRIVRDHADAVFMLKGWPCSPGAVREIKQAAESGKKVYYQGIDA